MKKSLIMTTAAVAGLGVVTTTQTVFASEAPTENTVNAITNNKVTDKDLSNAEKRVIDTAKDADQKTKDTSQAKDELNKAQNEKNTKKAEKEALEKDLEKAKEATPEKIQTETQDVDTKEKAKADKEADVKNKAAQVGNKSDNAKRAQEELNKARTGVEKADRELKDATDDFDPAAKNKAQKEKDDADKDVLMKDQAKRNAEAELEKAKENDKTREAKKVQERQNKANKEAEKAVKEGLVKDADKAIKEAEEKLKSAQYPTEVTATPEWIAKAKELIRRRMDKFSEPSPDTTGMTADQIKKAYDERNARFKEWLKTNRNDIQRLENELRKLDQKTNEKWRDNIRNIRNNGIQDDTDDVQYDPNNLPQDVVDDLNNHFITLLNSLRKQLDLPEAKLNTNNKDFAKEVAKVYKDNDYQGYGHFGRGINEVARKRGLKASANPGVDTYSQYYENLMPIPMNTDKMSRQELLSKITETFMSFFAEGYLTGHYLHFYSLLQVDNLGLNTSLIQDKDLNSLYYFRIHVLSVGGPNYIGSTDSTAQKAKFNELYGPNSKSNLPTPILQNKQEVEAELQKAKADKKTAATGKKAPALFKKHETAAASGKGNPRSTLLNHGKKFIGTPYVWGGASPKGFDCSGLVHYLYQKQGVSIPRNSREQFSRLPVASNPQPGDLVFFRRNGVINHVGLYLGGGKMLHAPQTGSKVRIEDMGRPNWKRRYAGARRALKGEKTVIIASQSKKNAVVRDKRVAKRAQTNKEKAKVAAVLKKSKVVTARR